MWEAEMDTAYAISLRPFRSVQPVHVEKKRELLEVRTLLQHLPIGLLGG